MKSTVQKAKKSSKLKWIILAFGHLIEFFEVQKQCASIVVLRWCSSMSGFSLRVFLSLLISSRAQPCKKVNASIHNGRSSLSTNTYVQPIAIQCSQHTLKIFRFCEIAKITEFIRPKESSCSFEIQYLFLFQN